jgi:hypothetical protein
MKNTALLGLALLTLVAHAKDAWVLPDPLMTKAGVKITTPAEWEKMRRPETLELFRKHIYGRTPIGRPDGLRFELVETNRSALDGKATLKRVAIHYSGPGGQGMIQLSVFIPNHVPRPAPGYLLICHRGRENIDPTRKSRSEFWPVENMVERGYMAAAFHVSDLDPDKHDGFKDGVHGIFDPKGAERSPEAWGTIAAWAWGASRAMDYFETDADIDHKRIGVLGHSRGGKAALWCGAEDQRFALVISNNSGCTGAALARRRKGETVEAINKSFPHWFCANYKAYNGKEHTLPVDQHQLIALMAPRLVYVASATEDAWADPEGEFLSCVEAAPVYRLWGFEGVGAAKFPKADHPLHTGKIGYHLRTGRHNLTAYDWKCFMDFADKNWPRR